MAKACRKAIEALKYKEGEHPGLLLSRYLKLAADNDESFNKEKESLYDGMISSASGGNLFDLYKRAYSKMSDSAPPHSIKTKFKTMGRTVVGLGSTSPVEVGIRLHHTYGTPVIPGSSLKGLAAHYCHTVWGSSDEKFKKSGEYHKTLFGTTDDSGHIIFYDAWLLPEGLKGCFLLDIMTPHHPEYYQSGSVDPSDFDDPTPIRFLSVQGSFLVALACDVKGDEGKKWTELALKLLTEALETWGIGGKTSSGYGRLKAEPAPISTQPSSSSSPSPGSGIADFIEWFDKRKFSSANKGQHNEIKEKIQKLPESIRKAAKDYVRSKLGEKSTTAGIWSFISSE